MPLCARDPRRRPRVPTRRNRRPNLAPDRCRARPPPDRPDGCVDVASWGALEERFTQHEIAPAQHHATLAGACLLEHAAARRQLLAARTDAHVSVDVDPDGLERAADAWGPPPRPG